MVTPYLSISMSDLFLLRMQTRRRCVAGAITSFGHCRIVPVATTVHVQGL